MTTITAGESAAGEEAGLSEAEYRDRLRDLPPSAKLVAKVLEIESPLSQAQVAEETLLPDRTVRYVWVGQHRFDPTLDTPPVSDIYEAVAEELGHPESDTFGF